MSEAGSFPLSADVAEHIRNVASKRPDLVKVRRAGTSLLGLPIFAVTVSDPAVPDKEKQNVLVVGGQHGNEESGRIVALALLDWLTTKAAAKTLRNQKVVIMPNVNPDSADTDAHGNAEGVWPDIDHGLKGAVSPEAKTLEAVANRLQPELFVDLHACGGTGCGMDMVLYPPSKEWTEDSYFSHRIANEMCQAGENAGITQITFPLSW